MNFWPQKKHLPNVCPKGHVYVPKTTGNKYDIALDAYYRRQGPIQVYDYFWKMKRWEFQCGDCSIAEAMQSTLFSDLLKNGSKFRFRGSVSVPIPFSKS